LLASPRAHLHLYDGVWVSILLLLKTLTAMVGMPVPGRGSDALRGCALGAQMGINYDANCRDQWCVDAKKLCHTYLYAVEFSILNQTSLLVVLSLQCVAGFIGLLAADALSGRGGSWVLGCCSVRFRQSSTFLERVGSS